MAAPKTQFAGKFHGVLARCLGRWLALKGSIHKASALPSFLFLSAKHCARGWREAKALPSLRSQSEAEVLKPGRVSCSPGLPGHRLDPRVSGSGALGWGSPRVCIMTTFPDDALSFFSLNETNTPSLQELVMEADA